MLDWAHKEIVEFQTFAKQISRKSPKFLIIATSAKSYKEMYKVSTIGRICL